MWLQNEMREDKNQNGALKPPPPGSYRVNMVMYADDTTLCCDIEYAIKYENLLNVKLCKITNWLAANKLSLDVGKIKFMVSHSDK